MEKEKLLDIKDLSVTYKTEDGIVYAVNNLNLTLEPKETLGFVGETGAGKTTTAMTIMGLLPTPPGKVTSGEIMFDGKDMLKIGDKERRGILGEKISMIFQDPMTSLDPVMRIGPQVEESLRIHTRMNALERRAAALSAMEEAELRDPEIVYEKYPHELSGGMLQRAMIAAAVVARPKLLLLDEPTTALDVTIQAQILELLKKLNRESGISMLFISHNLNVVRKLCTRTAVMQRGVLVEEGDIETVFRHPRHPYTQRLIAAIPTRHRKEETP